MKMYIFKTATLVLLLAITPITGKAEVGWTLYKPGIVKSAIANEKSVILAYLSSW